MAEARPLSGARRGRLTGVLVAGLVFIADQVSKWLVFHLAADQPMRVAVAPFLNIVTAWNTGVSFGLLAFDQGVWALVLALLALAICAGLGLWLWRSDTRLQSLALGLVIGGALGNVADRLVFLKVRDFIDVHVGGWHWPAFNLADSAITVGAVILIVLAFRPHRGHGN
ncbi:MAG: signal peptidase II [Alphaproteobacteria bacterium]